MKEGRKEGRKGKKKQHRREEKKERGSAPRSGWTVMLWISLGNEVVLKNTGVSNCMRNVGEDSSGSERKWASRKRGVTECARTSILTPESDSPGAFIPLQLSPLLPCYPWDDATENRPVLSHLSTKQPENACNSDAGESDKQGARK